MTMITANILYLGVQKTDNLPLHTNTVHAYYIIEHTWISYSRTYCYISSLTHRYKLLKTSYITSRKVSKLSSIATSIENKWLTAQYNECLMNFQGGGKEAIHPPKMERQCATLVPHWILESPDFPPLTFSQKNHRCFVSITPTIHNIHSLLQRTN